MATRSVCALLLAISTAPALADPSPVSVTTSVERHHTSNALDSSFAVPDWYTLMRGSLQHQWQHETGYVRLGAEAEASRYDTISIENDRAAVLQLEATGKTSPELELRGALTYRISSQGDDLPIATLILGTRTKKQVFAAETQIGIDLGGGTALVLELADAYEKIGAARFQQSLLAPAKLDPDRNRLVVGARLVRSVGPLAYGVSASTTSVAVEELGFPPVGLSLSQYALRLEGAWTDADAGSLNSAIGFEMLRGAEGIYEDIRPTYRVAFAKPLPNGFELRGALFARFETADSDDPLASWLRRGEIEARLRVSDQLLLASGLFGESKDNLLLENQERAHGAYAEASYDATRTMALVVRVDFTDRFLTVLDERRKTLDAFVGIRTKL
ncbi:hypothetical protein EET67_02465 [Pseudaminobacter arsenicus]|uniref:Porin n=1 Tax=Borborobacter arsenicus TaxID=1851146 RepID=A0A432VC80_9HYPH|nr:hypothetical protein [Pseudaminobacter arsenicus]RUM99768.1 hypothetical protein EET67_02465 [Pseudaminobacter arsenicus]